jgi:hypothetical protein
LIAALGSEIRIRDGLIVVNVMIALGMADEVDCSGSHGSGLGGYKSVSPLNGKNKELNIYFRINRMHY